MNGAPRPNYLGATLDALTRAGVWTSPSLHSLRIVDSGSDEEQDFWRTEIGVRVPASARHLVSIDAPPTGQRRTLHQTASRAIQLASATTADWVLVLEDDLDVCADFLGSVAAWLSDHDGLSVLYAFGANYVQVAQSAHYGRTSWPYPVHAFYGAQALAWRRADAAQCAAWLGEDPAYHGKRTRGHDLLLQEWGRSRGVSHFLASAPSFVDHVGATTTLSTTFFRFPSWPGRRWSYARTGVIHLPAHDGDHGGGGVQ